MRLILIFFGVLLALNGSSQLDDGSTAPNFTLDDLDGVTHELYDYLDDGKGAIIDFSATWCGFCWNYHNSGTLDDVWDMYGPDGSDEIIMFFIEADPGTSEPCIYGSSGCSGGSIGDWTAGVEYPIINPNASDASDINSDYEIIFYPTIYAIGPNYKAYEVGQPNVSGWGNWIESFTLEAEFVVSSVSDCTNLDLELEVTGGFGSYTYLWSDGSTESTLVDAPEGTYSVEITDSNGYTIEVGPIDIGSGDGISLQLEEIEDVSCYEGDDGSIEVSADFGSGDYSYEWDNDETGSMITNLESGEYTVTATDLQTLCSSVETYEIEEQDEFVIEATITAADCDGENGALSLDVDGGQGNLTYFLNGTFVNGPEIDDLAAGSYTIFVNDAVGCNTSKTVEIGQPAVPVADTIVPSILTCQQSSIELNADSSTVGMNIIYRWMIDSIAIDTGLIVQTDTFGLFTLVVEDTISTCNDSLMFVVDVDTLQPTIMAAPMDSVLTCSVIESVLEGNSSTTDIQAAWRSSDGVIISESLDATINAPDTYTFSVTDTINGCLSIDSVIVAQDLTTPIIELLSIGTLDCETTSTEISTSASIGDTYQWSRNGTVIIGATESNITVSEVGDYSLVATNATTECTTTETYTVESATDLPVIELSQPQVLTCNQTLTTISVNQEEDYAYTWMNDQGQILLSDETVFTTSEPGSYTLEVRNVLNNCTTTSSFVIEEDISSPTIAFAQADVLTCNTTSVSLSVLESENVAYTWTTELGSIVSESDKAQIEVDAAAVYMVEATNLMNGCTSISFIEVTNDIAEPQVAIAQPDRLTCDVTEVLIQSEVRDGITYEWTTNIGAIVGTNDTNQLRVTQAGLYTLLTTDDNNGCTSEASVVVEESIDLPTITLAELGTIQCNEPIVSIALDANPDHTYQWTTDAGEIVTSSNQALIEVSAAGMYTVVVTDPTNGCVSSASYIVESSTDIPEVNIQGQALACAGEVVLLCSDNTDDSLAWYVDGEVYGTESCIEVIASSEVELFATNEQGCEGSSQFEVVQYAFPDFQLAADTYTLSCVQTEILVNYEIEGQDAFSAVWKAGQSVIAQGADVLITEPGTYSLEIVNNQTGCLESMNFQIGMDDTVAPVSAFDHEGLLAATFTDESTGEIEGYLWSFGDGNTSTEANPSYTYQLPGYYEVCLTVSNFCGSSLPECQTILAADPIVISSTQVDLICYDGGTGLIELILDAGLAPYEVEWSGPQGFAANGTSITNLQAGEYQAIVTDQGITNQLLNFTLNESDQIIATADITDSTTGLSDGAISVEVSGGNGPYEYQWSNGSTDQSITNLEEGNYSVLITDASNCSITEEYMVNGIISSTAEVSWAKDITISPNPSTGRFELLLNQVQLQDAQVDIIDASGVKVWSGIYRQTNERYAIDLSSQVTSGMYLIRITKAGESVIKKIAIVK